jgi:23S rRNA (uracil1939-C5)-methyltransferase
MRPGDRLTVRIEKPAAGGRMIARHDGAVLLVSAAIPGELVDVVVDRVQRHTAWAHPAHVLEPSPDRVDSGRDPACGGSVYAHVRYERQLALKQEIVRDAFARIARLPLEHPVPVTGSPTDGYRLRARLHVRGGRAGFFREGTHTLCDPATTRQLRPDTMAAIERLVAGLAAATDATVTDFDVSENVAATERACHLELAPGTAPSRLAASTMVEGFGGVSCWPGDGTRALTLWGTPSVTDVLSLDLGGPHATEIRLTRQARSFFQGNRYLLSSLAARVAALTPPGPVVDLYAGVGLFAIAIAARGESSIVAVEGDAAGAEDLARNARPFGERVKVQHQPVERVESALARARESTIIVDPPRTGLSREALARVVSWRAPRLVYVSCDVATLARDARAIVDAGYRLATVEAFDLFPETAHVESVVAFDRVS